MMYKRDRPKADPPPHAASQDEHEPSARRRDRSKQILLVATVAAFAAILMIVGQDEDEEFIRLAGHTSAEDGVVIVSGSTNLPDGAVLQFKVLDADSTTAFAHSYGNVTDGTFQASVAAPTHDGETVTDGSIVVEVTFEIVMEDRTQPPELIERFGGIGRRMTGETVVETEHGRRLVWRLPVQR